MKTPRRCSIAGPGGSEFSLQRHDQDDLGTQRVRVRFPSFCSLSSRFCRDSLALAASGMPLVLVVTPRSRRSRLALADQVPIDVVIMMHVMTRMILAVGCPSRRMATRSPTSDSESESLQSIKLELVFTESLQSIQLELALAVTTSIMYHAAALPVRHWHPTRGLRFTLRVRLAVPA